MQVRCMGEVAFASDGYTSLRIVLQQTTSKEPRVSKDEFEKGDKVEWKTHGTTTQGEVEKKITSETEAAGRTVKASKDEPQYQVRSDKSGKDAVHKPDALQPKD